MSKKNFQIFLILSLLIFCTHVVYSDEATQTTPIMISGSNTWSHTFDDMIIEFDDPNPSIAISIITGSSITTNQAFNSLTLSQSANLSNDAPTSFVGISVFGSTFTICAPTFTINNTAKASLIRGNDSTISIEGALNLVSTAVSPSYDVAIAAIYLENESVFVATNPTSTVTINTVGNYNAGLLLRGKSSATFEGNLDISTMGRYSNGILTGYSAPANGGTVFTTIKGNLTITTDGEVAIGLASVSDSDIHIHGNVKIDTEGDGSSGISLATNSTYTIDGNLTIGTSGGYLGDNINAYQYSAGIERPFHYSPDSPYYQATAQNSQSIIVKGNTSITNSGTLGHGILLKRAIATFGTIFGSENIITVSGVNAYGINLSDVTATFSKTTIYSAATGYYQYQGTVVFTGPLYILSDGLGLGASGYFSTTGPFSEGTSLVFNDTVTITSSDYHGMEIGGSGAYMTTLTFHEKLTIKASDSGIRISDSASNVELKFLKGASITADVGIEFSSPGTIITDNGSPFENFQITSNVAFWYSNGTTPHTMVFNDSEIIGDIATLNNTAFFTLDLRGNSFWQGGEYVYNITDSLVNLNLSGTSYWRVAGNYGISDMTWSSASDGDIIKFTHEGTAFHAATIINLTNSSTNSEKGIITLNLSTGNGGENDRLDVTSANGDFLLRLVPHSTNGYVAEFSLLSISSGSYTLSLDDSFHDNSTIILLGDYYYTLTPVESAGITIYKLVLNDINVVIAPYTSRAKSSLIGLYELSRTLNEALSDELYSRNDDYWASVGTRRQNFRGLTGAKDFDQYIYSVFAGVNLIRIEDFTLGLAINFNVANQVMGVEARGLTTALSLAVSAGYQIKGFLLDGHIGLTNYTQKNVQDNGIDDKINLFGLSTSVQVARQFDISSLVYISPKARFSFTKIFGSLDLLNITLENKGVLTTSAGLRVGKEFMVNTTSFDVYVEGNYSFNTGSNYKLNSISQDAVTVSPHQIGIGAGFDVLLPNEFGISLAYKFTTSKNLVEPYYFRISFSFNF